jgi:hypothetical protein
MDKWRTSFRYVSNNSIIFGIKIISFFLFKITFYFSFILCYIDDPEKNGSKSKMYLPCSNHSRDII